MHTELNRLTQQSESLRRRDLDLKQRSDWVKAMLISKSNVLGRPVVTENKIGHLPKCVWGSISLGHFFLRWYWYFNVKLLMCSRIWIHNTSYLQDERFCLTASMHVLQIEETRSGCHLGCGTESTTLTKLIKRWQQTLMKMTLSRSVHLSSTSIQNFLSVFLCLHSSFRRTYFGKAWNQCRLMSKLFMRSLTIWIKVIVTRKKSFPETASSRRRPAVCTCITFLPRSLL